ncbi:MAG: cyclic nucleotide-binding domain-containing protein [Proteobacteria bacterium]|jgi:CRP-like cAMP-binding protein|nr:cyclic nucleotide-binding domain-containing protein [Pseudomonadota bacterium]
MKTIAMLTPEELRALLKETIFSSLDDTALEKLLPLFERHQVDRGEFIRYTDETSGSLYIVETGSFSLCDSDHSILQTFERGGCIGLLSTIFAGEQLLDTQALEDSTLIVLDAGSLKMLEVSEPALALQILRCIRTALAPSMHQAIRLMYHLYQS